MPTPEIRAKAAELTKNAKTDAEKEQAVYNYVSSNFRYISISFGIGRYQPHAAAEVLKNAYGDCKDKHTLLASLLQAVGLNAYPVLINATRKIDPDVCSPGQFDHVIIAVPQGDSLLWLDTTPEVAPFGFLLVNLRDKQALVIPPEKAATLVKSPVDLPFKPFLTVEVQGKLGDDGTLRARVQETCRGDVEVLLRAAFRRAPQTQWKDLVQNLSYAQGYGGTVSNVAAAAPEATDEPFLFSYDYTRKDYPEWSRKRITAPLPEFDLPEPSDDAASAAKPIFLGVPGELHYQSNMEIPKGFAPLLLRQVDLSRDFAEYHSAYTFNAGIWTTDLRLTIRAREVPVSQKEDYRSFQKTVSEGRNLYTNLIPGSYAPLMPAPSPEAQKVFEDATEASNRGDFRLALELCERALKLDPTNTDGWYSVASLRIRLNQLDEALTALRKVIELDPKDPMAYKTLVAGLVHLHRQEEAVQVWRDLLKQYPNDGEAHAHLGNVLLQAKRYREAIPEISAGLTNGQQTATNQMQLAQAYLGVGDNDEAVAACKKAVELNPKPDTWNAAAYVLADHNLDLAEAQEYAENAVQAHEREAAGLQLDSPGESSLRLMDQLVVEWGTVGWVYFRQGNLEKAEKYLRAAWVMSQRAVIGDHLGQVYEKLGRREAAMHMYACALGVAETAEETRERLSNLVKDEVQIRTLVLDARTELSRVRTVQLGKLVPKFASGEFIVLFAPGSKVEGVRFRGGDEALRSATQAVACAKFDLPFPDDAPTKLVRKGRLVCSEYSGCDFAFDPVGSVPSVVSSPSPTN